MFHVCGKFFISLFSTLFVGREGGLNEIFVYLRRIKNCSYLDLFKSNLKGLA
jgi:hypothetical protein